LNLFVTFELEPVLTIYPFVALDQTATFLRGACFLLQTSDADLFRSFKQHHLLSLVPAVGCDFLDLLYVSQCRHFSETAHVHRFKSRDHDAAATHFLCPDSAVSTPQPSLLPSSIHHRVHESFESSLERARAGIIIP
jgi:hypothetical protein